MKSLFSSNYRVFKSDVKSAKSLEIFAEDFCNDINKPISAKRLHEICNESIISHRDEINGYDWKVVTEDVIKTIKEEII